MPEILFDTVYESAAIWRPYSAKIIKICDDIKNIISSTLNFPDEIKKIEIAMTFSNNKRLAILNKEYLQKEGPTNVMSFPSVESHNADSFYETIESEISENILADNIFFAGDIIFAFEKIKAESEEYKRSFENHLTHLIIHATLHLFGYDHVNDEDAKIMQDKEISLLETLGIPSPYDN